MTARVNKDLRDIWVQSVIPNDRVVEATVTGFAVFAAISLVGIVVVFGWVGLVSVGIRRDDRGVVISAPAVGLNGAVPGRVRRIARQATGFHWV
jgi:hypothetical protein